MEIVVIAIFVIGYLAIALEHNLEINKTASALLTGVLCWTIFAVSPPADAVLQSDALANFLDEQSSESVAMLTRGSEQLEVFRGFVVSELSHHLAAIAEILFFLMGAMTIVELIDAHHGFRFITDRIRTRHPLKLLWIVCWFAFLLSAVLDNLTTTIVMISLIRKLVPDLKMRHFFAGMIVIAANAGGAWSPIGDVTTTMLWIGGQITTVNIVKSLLVPSLVSMLTPLLLLSFTMRSSVPIVQPDAYAQGPQVGGGKLMLFLGVAVLISVPIFKTVTQLPPYMGMLFGVGILWVISELIHPDLDVAERKAYTAAGALSRIDVPSVLFFLGILLAVGALESMQTLHHLALWLSETVGDTRLVITLTGLLSAVIDNVPLVAASIGMYGMEQYPQNSMIWEYLAYCAGTGGSILIIGSAAGVAAMGMEKIDFFWYIKRISLIALVGYFAGAATYLLLET